MLLLLLLLPLLPLLGGGGGGGGSVKLSGVDGRLSCKFCYVTFAIASPLRSLAWVVGFTMGPFPASERPWKPFNPILGETFEYAKPHKGMKYIAEQVGWVGGW